MNRFSGTTQAIAEWFTRIWSAADNASVFLVQLRQHRIASVAILTPLDLLWLLPVKVLYAASQEHLRGKSVG